MINRGRYVAKTVFARAGTVWTACSKCKEVKDAASFTPCRKAVSGLQSQCKACKAIPAPGTKERNAARYQANKDLIRGKQRARATTMSDADKAALREKRHAYYLANRESIRSKQAARAAAETKLRPQAKEPLSPEQRKAYKAAWHQRNKERLALERREKYRANREQILAKQKLARDVRSAADRLRDKQRNVERYLVNKDKVRAQQYAAYMERSKSPKRLLERRLRKSDPAAAAAYQAAKHGHLKAVKKAWLKANPEKAREHQRRRDKKRVDDLHDVYVKGRIHRITGLSTSVIPRGLVEAVREVLRVKRFIKDVSKGESE